MAPPSSSTDGDVEASTAAPASARPGTDRGTGRTRRLDGRVDAGVLTRRTRAWLVVAVMGLAACRGGAGGPGGAGEAADERDRLARDGRVLEQRLALASADVFYLVLSPAERELTLMLKGAELQVFPLERVEIGAPRVAFRSRPVLEWAGVVWRSGELQPERVVPRVEIASGADDTPPPVPALPEDVIRVPARFRVAFADGLVVDVRTMDETADGLWTRARERLRAAWSAFADDPAARLRVRLTMSRASAESFYRSLPPDASLLILPPDFLDVPPSDGRRSRQSS
ncbi:MAG: hypothetical protein U0Q12_15925 [Vicinamibacterales bacterium]